MTMWMKLMFAWALAVAVVSAQGGGMGGGMGSGMGGGGGSRNSGMGGGDSMERSGMGGMGRPSNRMEMISQLLKLDKDQKKEVKSIMDEGQKDAAPVKEEITKTRSALAEAIASGKKGEDLKPLESACAAAAAHMHQIELSSFAKVYQLLDKDQQPRSGQLFGMMAGLFHGKNWIDLN